MAALSKPSNRFHCHSFKLKVNYIRQKKLKYKSAVYKTFKPLEQGQRDQAWSELVKPKQGYNPAKFENLAF